jgi:hypothetical protein
MLTPKVKAAIIAVVVIVVVVGVALGAFFGTKSSKSSKPGPMFPPYVPNSGGSGSHVPGSVSVSTGSFGSSGSSFDSSFGSFGSSGSSGSSGSAGGDSNTFNVNGEQMVPIGAQWSPDNFELNILPGSLLKGIHSRNPVTFPWSATFTCNFLSSSSGVPTTATILYVGFSPYPLQSDPPGVRPAPYGLTWNIRLGQVSASTIALPYTSTTLAVKIAVDTNGTLSILDPKFNTPFAINSVKLPSQVLPQSGTGLYFVLSGTVLSQGAGIDIQIS